MGAFNNDLAERSVLNILLNNDCQSEIVQLTPEDFYDPLHQVIFSAIQSMAAEKKAIDLVTVDTALTEKLGQTSKPAEDRLMEIATSSHYPGQFMLKEYMDIIKSCSMRRRIYLTLAQGKKDLSEDGNDPAAVLESLRQQLRDMVVTRHSWKSMQTVLVETYGALEKKSKGEETAMMSGVSGLDNITAGFHGGEFTIIGARPAVGKSAFGAQVALGASKSGYKVGICSREMTAVQYGTRIFAHGTDVDPKKLRTGQLDQDDWIQLAQALNLYGQENISFIFTAKYIEDLRMEVQRQVDSGNMDMLVLDYIQQMQTKQRIDKDYLRIAYISKMLKDMSTDFNISVVGLAQVGRQADASMPTLAELRGSGDLEQDADNVIFLHRPSEATDKYVHPQDRELFATMKQNGLQYIAINVAKQRQGEIGTLAVAFNPGRMRYTMIEREAATRNPPGFTQVPDSDAFA